MEDEWQCAKPRIEQMSIELAKEKKPEERNLLQTLLALDVPFQRALDLVVNETTRAVNGTMAQYAWLIRDSRATYLPEGSEERRRVLMIADMLDPNGEDTWKYPKR